MSIRVPRLSRRKVLKGMLHGSALTLGLPLFEQMLDSHGTALAAGTSLPRRYGIFFWGNGLPWTPLHKSPPLSGNPPPMDLPATDTDLWTPTTTGTTWDLTPLMMPLAKHKANLSVVTGLEPKTEIPTSPVGLGDGHMRGITVILTGDEIRPMGFDHDPHIFAVNRATLDQVIAKHPMFYTDGPPRFRSLELGVSEATLHNFGTWTAMSHNGPNSLNMPVRKPQELFDQVFGVKPDTAETARRVSVLDVVAEDTRHLQARLGKRDRARLDEHLTHINEIERRLKLAQAACTTPAAPKDPFAGEPNNMARLNVLADILVAALRCDLTRVFSLYFTTGASVMQMNTAGQVNGAGARQMHEAVHGGDRGVILACVKYHMQAFALLLDKLAAETDVNGQTLLDSACILGTSEYGEGFTHSDQEFPVLFAGKAGGGLQPGWHVRERGGNLSRVHLTILRAMGIDAPSYGFSGGETSQPLPFLKA
jgi:hypothetical protein